MNRLPAPGTLETVRLFINTLDVESGEDQFGTGERACAWLVEHGLLDAGSSLNDDESARVRTVREALRALALANNGEHLEPAVFDALNAAADRAYLKVRFVASDQAAVEPAVTGVDGAIGRLLAIVAESMAAGTWARLKACRSDACQWAFYDSSRNRSGAWCSMAVCGNRAKVRVFRTRRRGIASTSHT